MHIKHFLRATSLLLIRPSPNQLHNMDYQFQKSATNTTSYLQSKCYLIVTKCHCHSAFYSASQSHSDSTSQQSFTRNLYVTFSELMFYRRRT